MNAVLSTLSSPRGSRIVFWLGAALLVAALVVFVIKKSDHGSSASVTSAKSHGGVLSQDAFQKSMTRKANIQTSKQWATVPAAAKLAVRRFIVDGAGERNLARAWQYTDPSLRGGLTYKQWVHGGQLPFTPFAQMNLKLPISITLTQWSGHDLLAEVGIASTDKTGRGAYTFNVGATKVGQGANARWLVNYWMPLYTPPVRADPSQNFGG